MKDGKIYDIGEKAVEEVFVSCPRSQIYFVERADGQHMKKEILTKGRK